MLRCQWTERKYKVEWNFATNSKRIVIKTKWWRNVDGTSRQENCEKVAMTFKRSGEHVRDARAEFE